MDQLLNGSPKRTPHLIAIDWGTSSFRAYLLASGGQVLDQVSLPLGILNVTDRQFSNVLEEACGTWLAQWPGTRVLMCGMIGSRSGWQEAHYLSGAVGVSELAAKLTNVETGASSHPVQIVPGLSGRDFAGGPDVMRGEETILVGALAMGAPRSGYYCLPGTHSKWVSMVDGRIGGFSTYLTGEMFTLLRDQSILSPLISADDADWGEQSHAAFLAGIDMSRTSAGLLHQLFSLRAGILTGEADATLLSIKLSGLLIGAELMTMNDAISGTVTLVSSGPIADRYQIALKHLGCDAITFDASECCRRGLMDIASAETASSLENAGKGKTP